MTGFGSKKQMAADKLQEPSATRPCRSCNGTGNRDTGIPESPIAICKPCNGTGQIALAQPAQEPVAWMYQCTADNSGPVLLQHRTNWAENGSGLWIETPLYTAPPQRQWIWLSDADIAEVVDTTCQYSGGYEEYLIKKAERKIRSMNT